jgi:hypothetical protein
MFSPTLMKLMAEARAEELRREASLAGRREGGARRPSAAEAAEVAITIRPGLPDDAIALTRLAALDSAPVPAAPILLAEADGQLRAALSLSDGASIAHPFHPTAATVRLLATRAAQLRGDTRRRRLVARLVGTVAPRRRDRTALTRSI